MSGDRQAAGSFLQMLDPQADSFIFQTFGDKKGGGNTLPGSLSDHWETISRLNAEGSGIGVAINAIDGDRRRNEGVTRIRAVWFDDDSGTVVAAAFPLAPSIVVETSPGRHHFYWLVSDRWDADQQGRADFRGLMQAMVGLGSDSNAIDLARALRLPGTLHQKGEKPYPVTIVGPVWGDPRRYTRQQLLDAFEVEALPAPAPASLWNEGARTAQADVDWARVQNALDRISSDDRSIWIKVGMALHSACQGSQSGYDIWRDWSKASAKYDPRELDRQWRSFRADPYAGVGIGTVFRLADRTTREGPNFPIFNWPEISGFPLAPFGEVQRPTGGLAERAMNALEATFRSWGHRPSSPQLNALGDLLRQLQALADGTAEPSYFLSSLDPGIGKTQAVIHFVRELLADPTYHAQQRDVAVLICVGRLAEIESYVADMGLSHSDYSVLVSDSKENQHLNQMGNPDRDKARVLFITQQMLESRVKRLGSFSGVAELYYHGAPRRVRLWDEACLPAKPLTIDATQIEGLTDAARRNGRGRLYGLLQAVISDIREAEAGSFVTIPYWEAEGLELGAVLNTYADAPPSASDVIRDLFLLSGATVTVHRDGQNRAFVHYENTLTDDLKPVVICDASGRVRQTYPHWQQGRGDIVKLRDAGKDYSDLSVHLWKRPGSKDAWKTGSGEMIRAIIEVVDSKPDEEFLIVHHKAARNSPDIPRLIRSGIANPSRVHFTHWQSEDCKATNRYRDVPNIILAGTLFYPSSYYEALGRLSRGVPSNAKLEKKVRADIEQGEHAHLILQAVCRGAIRKAVDGKCGKGEVWIIAAAQSGIPDLIEGRDIFPGSQVMDWLPVPKAPARGKAGEAIRLVDQWSREGGDSRLPVADIREAVGIIDRKNFKKDILDHEGFKAALEERSIRHVSVRGRGRGSYLERIWEGQLAA